MLRFLVDRHRYNFTQAQSSTTRGCSPSYIAGHLFVPAVQWHIYDITDSLFSGRIADARWFNLAGLITQRERHPYAH
jgi:hypothetical protein